MNCLGESGVRNFARFCGVFLLSVFIPKLVAAANFTVTGYYSPLPNQEFYLTGNYESEIRLNGRGIQGADGTHVYHGMIAAPKNYKFGTNICLDNLGCGTVHDRGGAIVNKGVRKKAIHDRIDYWMGYGVTGLEKALEWGVQSVGGSFSTGAPRKLSLLEKKEAIPLTLLEIVREGIEENIFEKNLHPGKTDKSVVKLKETLHFLRFFRGEINNKYDEVLKKAVLNFQLKHNVVDSENERGAGNFGPKTREKIEEVILLELDNYFREKWKTNVFEENLSYDDHEMDVFRLQQLLLDKGFLIDATPTGYFGDKTKSALKSFQIAHELIRTKNDVGAGNFGPKTRKKMKELWIAKRDGYFPPVDAPNTTLVEDEIEIEEVISEPGLRLVFLEKETEIAKDYFDESVILFRGKSNENVRKLQKALKKLEFFAGNTTGNYGDKTAEAVLAFQYKHDIVESRRSVGASVFGPSTRAKLNEIMK